MNHTEQLNNIAKANYSKEYIGCTQEEKAVVLKQWIDENIELIP
tara:strand:- start:1353 stop:1484 length:132 start_codon:yes stop_codon:yes gene_type:complete